MVSWTTDRGNARRTRAAVEVSRQSLVEAFSHGGHLLEHVPIFRLVFTQHILLGTGSVGNTTQLGFEVSPQIRLGQLAAHSVVTVHQSQAQISGQQTLVRGQANVQTFLYGFDVIGVRGVGTNAELLHQADQISFGQQIRRLGLTGDHFHLNIQSVTDCIRNIISFCDNQTVSAEVLVGNFNLNGGLQALGVGRNTGEEMPDDKLVQPSMLLEIQTTCQCGLAGKLFTVRKEGPNKGRTFYACSKIGQGRCNFFAWADFGPAPLSRSAMVQSQSNTFGQYFPQSTVQGHSAGRGYQAGKGMKAVRKCGLCRQPGHNVKNCPEKFT
ncbi:DNA topoisomerase 3-alpha [Trichinella pseudospiralis]|uniref:DNA topoisomerase 3-alpha n=1 Tax=Trichinella pseudospiralis TaxID=6337 RepID=A0A0V0Y833_TRIPS|nr:DNA topoisomerase 3-alpha [Trichinella pseudospiralis]